MYDAPETVLMFALCAARVSWSRIGAAWVLICWDRPSNAVSWTNATLVIFLPLTVTLTWTMPYRVCSAVPV